MNTQRNVLVCGGAGYIGSHMVRLLRRQGHGVVVFDNLSTGHAEAVAGETLVHGDLLDEQALARLFAEYSFDAVMHFSALSIVPHSVADPMAYYRNNVTGTLNLLRAMHASGAAQFIFSSSAAVYGMPRSQRIDEEHPTSPINPYGRTKLMVEQALADLHRAGGVNSLSFRYFNAAGAAQDATIGESHNPETHLIPNMLKSLLADDGALTVYGDDYDTPDGTCVRDYIHVDDIAAAHLLGLDYLADNPGAHVMNLGNGKGFSILELIATAQQVTGLPVRHVMAPRRPGDPPHLVASGDKAAALLGWRPSHTDVGSIIESAWNWHRNQPY